MSGRALTYLTDFFGTDGDAEVRKSTLRTAYRELIGSLKCRIHKVILLKALKRLFHGSH